MINQELLVSFLRIYTFQPATALWRAVEVDILRGYIPTTGRCLDLGCGDGKLTSLLFENKTDTNFILVGIDSDEFETKQAALNPLYRKVHTCLGSNIPEDAESFDYGVSNSVLEHIQDLEPTIAEVSRLVRSGGKFIFTVPGPDFHKCLYGPLNQHQSREQYLQDIDKRLAHYRYLDLQGWSDLLSKNGLQIEEHVEYLNSAEVQRWESISRFTGGILYSIVGQKYSPMTIQKKSGLRNTQNRLVLPRWMATILTKMLLIGLKDTAPDKLNGCLLIVARKSSQ